jgi:hypothetical protein
MSLPSSANKQSISTRIDRHVIDPSRHIAERNPGFETLDPGRLRAGSDRVAKQHCGRDEDRKTMTSSRRGSCRPAACRAMRCVFSDGSRVYWRFALVRPTDSMTPGDAAKQRAPITHVSAPIQRPNSVCTIFVGNGFGRQHGASLHIS